MNTLKRSDNMNAVQKLNIELYKKIFLIRTSEKAIIKYYNEDEMKTPMHMSMGEEAITAGVCHALGEENQALGYYRSHALYLSKTGDTDKFFAEMYGKATGAVGGRGGSMHLAAPSHGLLGVSAVVGTTIAPAVGVAFANKMQKNGKIVASFFGDGALEEGVAWESINAACLWKLPIIFVCEDNGLAVDVTSSERQGFKSIADVAKAYRCLVLESDSTDPETIYNLTLRAINHIKEKLEPVFMQLKYYRMLQHIGIITDFDITSPRPKGGFEKTGYRSKEEYDKWLKKDPVKISRAKLLMLGVTEEEIKELEDNISNQVERSVLRAKGSPFPKTEEIHDHVYTPISKESVMAIDKTVPQKERKITFSDAINEALHQEMARDSSVFVYGIENKVFGSLKGLAEKFGQERCFVTPLSEEAMTGIGLGASLNGMRPIHTHIRIDFFLLSMNQLINMISSYHYGTRGMLRVPLVIRAVVGRGWGQGFQHSKSLHSLFAHIPGLKVIMPTTPYDAKGLLTSAIRDDNPVISIEHRWLYWQEGHVPEYSYTVPIGEPNVLRKGSDITIVATSWMNVEAVKAAEILAKQGIQLEVIDLRSAAPLNDELIIDSVNKTGHCIVADNDWVHCGLSAEIAARISEKCFGKLRSPVARIGFAHTPCPTTRPLENEFYPNAINIIRAVENKLRLSPTDLTGEEFYSHENRFKGPF